MITSLLPAFDCLALAAFLALWIGYAVASERFGRSERSLSAMTSVYRVVWMRALCNRDNRVADSSLMGSLMHSVSFFASASVLMLGGVVALIGSGDRAWSVFQQMPMADADGGLVAFEIKLGLLACVFVYAFFHITWSLRQFNYCCLMLGAAPAVSDPQEAKDVFVHHAGRLQALAADSFNQGMRSYYFSLAMLTWFFSSALFVAATVAVVAVLYRREFRSKTFKALKGAMEAVER